MIHGVFGKLGAGKGLHVMEVIVDELINGFRDIVTNVPLRFQPWVNGQGIPHIGLKSYIMQRIKCSDEVADEYIKRVKLVEEVDELWDMFLWRRDGETGEWFKMTSTHVDEKGRPDRFDPNEAKARHANSCLVVSDEAWICYPNNGGWSRSPLIPFYARQQRKLRDEWYIVTQHPTDVDSVIWNITQDFIVCRNHGMERMGLFRQPAMFRTITYLTNPAKGNAVRSHEAYKRLDAKGLAQCYDTTAGVGFSGGFAGDANQKKKGLHIAWLLIAVVGLVACLAFVPHMLGKGASAWIGHTLAKPDKPAQWAGITNNGQTSVVPSSFHSGRTNEKYPTKVTDNDEELVCTGFVIAGRNTKAFLSDGRIVTPEDDLEIITKKYVIVSGQKIRILQSPLFSAPSQTPRSYETHDNYQPARASETQQNYQPAETYEVPVNQVSILSGIHGQGGNPQPRVSGFSQMQQNRQNQQNR